MHARFIRRGRLLLPALFAVALVLPGVAAAQDSESAEGSSGEENLTYSPAADEEAVPDQVIVKFTETARTASRADARSEQGLEKIEDLELIDAEVVEVEGQSVEEAITDLESRPDVEYAEPDYIRYPSGYADEPRYGELWGLNNTGQTVQGSAGSANVDLNGLEASVVAQGDSNLVVAVIDDGVDFTHPDLADRKWVNPGEVPNNGRDDDGNGYTDDVNGWDFVNNDSGVHNSSSDSHGTHVSGTIAASVNGRGVTGVAPNVKIMALNFLGAGPGAGSVSKEIKAIEYATKMGARISNNSYGALGFSKAEKDAIEASGQLFVTAAGNSAANNDKSATADYPAAYDSPNILSVAAIDNKGNLASFSNYGASSVDISAPGVGILSTVTGNTYAYYNGTSMAAPHAAGTAALAASANPGLLTNPTALKNQLTSSGKAAPATAGKTASGKMLDARAATGSPPGGIVPSPPPPSDEDTAAPKGSVSIEGGAAKTSSRSVLLTLNATSSSSGSEVVEMRISNNDGAWSSWYTYDGPGEYSGWILSKGKGTKTVYVQYKDAAGNVSATVSDTIKKR